jgi:PAS domain S-box-containing protein
MTGYEKDKIVGKSLYTFFDSESIKILEKQAHNITNTEHRNYDVRLLRKDGTKLPIKLQATTIRNESGKITDIVAFISDVMDLHEAAKKDGLTGICNRKCFDDELERCYNLM